MNNISRKIQKLTKKIKRLKKKLRILKARQLESPLYRALENYYAHSLSSILKRNTPFLQCSISKPLPEFTGGKTIQFFTYDLRGNDGA